MSFNFDEYYNNLNVGEVILSFKGGITSEVINQVLENVEKKLEDINADPKTRKKMYNVLVEGMQNLYHHVDEVSEDINKIFNIKFGVIVITKNDNNYLVNTGNFVSASKVKFLKDKIDKINSLSEEELKDMYKFILNHQKLSAKGGGGLGLVDIARKTGNKLEYNFYNYNNDYYFYNLGVIIN